MSLIHHQSCECTKSELDLFSVPYTQTSVEQGRYVEYGPISRFNDGPIEFDITGSETEYIDLVNSLIFVKVRIVNADGTVLANDAEVAPVNLFLHSIFSQVDLTLGDTLVTSSANTYPYRAYIGSLLTFGDEAKNTQMTASLWYKDTAGQMLVHADNGGYQKRRALAARSSSIEMIGKLHIDMFYQDRYLLNGVGMKLRLVPQSSRFCLMAGGDDPTFKYEIVEAKMMMRKVKLSDAVQLAHSRALEISPSKYPIRRVEVKSFNISQGLLSTSEDSLFSGQIPKRIVLGFIANNAFNGTYATNPFNFNHCNLQQITLTVDGQQIPSKPLEPNFGTNEYIQSYISLYTGTGMMFKDDGNAINREEYKAGYTLFAYDLTPDMEEGTHNQLIRNGIVALNLKFRQALANAINVVCYAEFENLIEIDRNRRVICDFSA